MENDNNGFVRVPSTPLQEVGKPPEEVGNSPAASEAPLAGWVLALAAGKTFIGRLVDGWRLLSPVYELTIVPIQIPSQRQMPDGTMQVNVAIQTQRMLSFIDNLTSWDELRLPDGAIIRGLDKFSLVEREGLAKQLSDLEQGRIQLQRQELAAKNALAASQIKNFGGGARDS